MTAPCGRWSSARRHDGFAVTVGGLRHAWVYAHHRDTLWLARGGAVHRVRVPSPEEARDTHAHGGDLRAPMPGQVLLVHAATGDRVAAGDPIVVLESMKMELTIESLIAGTLIELSVTPGDQVALDQTLARVEPDQVPE